MNAGHSCRVDLGSIGILSVLVLEDLVGNDIVKVLVNFIDHGCLDEIVELGVKLARLSDPSLVSESLNVFVLRILLNIRLEVVKIAGLLLSQITMEERKVVGLSLLDAFRHASLTTFMRLGV